MLLIAVCEVNIKTDGDLHKELSAPFDTTQPHLLSSHLLLGTDKTLHQHHLQAFSCMRTSASAELLSDGQH